MHRFLLLAALLGCCVLHTARAQDVVVSEYINQPSPELAEWNEIVIVKDDLNLVGFIVTDNNSFQTVRQGGVRFKDLPIFRHVREGTIIVIHHRVMPTGVPTDADPSDGYMEIAATNQTYFDPVLFATGSTWDLSALNIAADGDFIEILRPDSTHVHGLGHKNAVGQYYTDCPQPKVNHKATVNNNNGVGVVGRSILAYNAGDGTDSTSMNNDVGGSSSRVTKGFPNKIEAAKEGGGMQNRNHLLWREWREPEWDGTPAVTIVTQTPTKHVISWTPLKDPYPQDSTTGVMILRDTNDFAGFTNTMILDGTPYAVGQRIGGSSGPLVIALLPDAAGAQYADSANISCGNQYTYRVVPYRYKHDTRLGSITPEMARGRQYNELQVASSAKIVKQTPTKPVLTASTTTICPGDTVVLQTVTPADSYEWYLNDQKMGVPSSSRIVVSEAGTYAVRSVSTGGCIAQSDAVTISYLPAQVINVTPSTAQVICPGASVTITADRDAPAFQWLRDGVTIPGETGKSYTAKLPGTYQVRTASSTGCPAVSPTVRVSYHNVRASATPSLVDFGTLDECETSSTQTFVLRNTGTESFIVSAASFPSGFTLSDPPLGFQIAPGQSQIVRLRFAPITAGVSTGKVTFNLVPCDAQVQVDVRGVKTKSSIAVDRAAVDFGRFVSCGAISNVRVDSVFKITNSGSVDVTIKAPVVSPPFYLLTQTFPILLKPGDNTDISVQYRPLAAFTNVSVLQEISFPFLSSTCSDTLRSTLVAATYRPSISLTTPVITLPPLSSCAATFDTTVTVKNDGNINLVVTDASATISMPGGPVTVEAGTSETFAIRITTPTTPGPFSIQTSFVADTCAIAMQLTVNGEITDTRPSLSSTDEDLGHVVRCETDPTRTKTLSIDVGASKSGRAVIQNITVSDPMFSVDVLPGAVVQGSLPFTVRYAPTADGAHNATITFTMAPCGDVLTLNVRGSASTLSRFIAPLQLDMGTIGPGQTVQRTIKLVNTGTDSVRIDPPLGVLPPFALVSATPSLPALIGGGDSVVYTISYTYTGPERADTTTLRSIVGAPCFQVDTTRIIGATAKAGVLTGVTISVPTDLTARSGEQVSVPYTMTTQTDISAANVRTLDVYVHYNATLLKSMTLTGGPTTSVSGTVLESLPGRARFTLTSPTAMVAAAPLFVVTCQTYMGDSTQTQIVIDSVIAPGILGTGENGLLVLTGDCAFSSRAAGIGPRASIGVRRVDDASAEIEFTTVTSDGVTIVMRDMTGAMVAPAYTATLPPGVHVIGIPTPDVAAGVYYISMDHGLIHRSIPILIAR